MNEIKLSGVLTRDPAIEFTPNGASNCKFQLSQRLGQGQYEDDHLFDCIAWKEVAEKFAEEFREGDAVEIRGSLRQEKWTSKNGERLSRIRIIVWNAKPEVWDTDPEGYEEEPTRKAKPRPAATAKPKPQPAQQATQAAAATAAEDSEIPF
jgi:single-strand DNA-binding protein